MLVLTTLTADSDSIRCLFQYQRPISPLKPALEIQVKRVNNDHMSKSTERVGTFYQRKRNAGLVAVNIAKIWVHPDDKDAVKGLLNSVHNTDEMKAIKARADNQYKQRDQDESRV